MRTQRTPRGTTLACALTLTCVITGPAARADNVVNYNFNNNNGVELGWVSSVSGSTEGWKYSTAPSDTGGAWQVSSNSNTAGSAAYLTSPVLVINNNLDWVNVVVSHRFDLPVTGTLADQLAQVQFQIDTGTGGWQGWRGVPNEYFVKENYGPRPDNVYPSFEPPTSLIPPLIASSTVPPGDVLAWSGTTTGFDNGDHQQSEFTLFFSGTEFNLQNGYRLQFQFVFANNVDTTGTTRLAWELSEVQIKGVDPYPIPEPGTLALAGIGGLGCLLAARRRRRRRPVMAVRAVCGSTAATVVVAVVIAWLLASAPGSAQTSWHVDLDDGPRSWCRMS